MQDYTVTFELRGERSTYVITDHTPHRAVKAFQVLHADATIIAVSTTWTVAAWCGRCGIPIFDKTPRRRNREPRCEDCP